MKKVYDRGKRQNVLKKVLKGVLINDHLLRLKYTRKHFRQYQHRTSLEYSYHWSTCRRRSAAGQRTLWIHWRQSRRGSYVRSSYLLWAEWTTWEQGRRTRNKRWRDSRLTQEGPRRMELTRRLWVGERGGKDRHHVSSLPTIGSACDCYSLMKASRVMTPMIVNQEMIPFLVLM